MPTQAAREYTVASTYLVAPKRRYPISEATAERPNPQKGKGGTVVLQ